MVDAFCPECRTDLSQTPQEVTDTARRTAAAVTGTAEDVAASYGRFYLTFLPLGCGIAALRFAQQREWEQAALACALACGLAWYWTWRGERTTVSGTSKTSKGPHTPQ